MLNTKPIEYSLEHPDKPIVSFTHDGMLKYLFLKRPLVDLPVQREKLAM